VRILDPQGLLPRDGITHVAYRQPDQRRYAVTRRTVRVRRIYDEPSADDGVRVLVDRVWPRGVRKDAAAIDEWNKDVAPSTDLRKWYGHTPERFTEFETRYREELSEPTVETALDHLRTLAERGTLTLLTATKDVEHSQAAVLAELLAES
jgi:uncharacterized protein YeaO (DUF488 family)